MAIEAFSRVLPVLLLIGLGVLIRRQAFLRPTTIDDLRKLVLNVTLPAALFLAMLQVEIEAKYAVVVVGVFGACVVVLIAAPRLRSLARIEPNSMPNLMAGFEAGMLGYALFGALFGMASLWRFAIVDIGQVLFVFFLLAPVVMRRTSGKSIALAELVAQFARTPVIIAIVAGIVGGAIGLEETLRERDLSDALLVTLGLIAALTTPLIAIVLGYSTSLRLGALWRPAAHAGRAYAHLGRTGSGLQHRGHRRAVGAGSDLPGSRDDDGDPAAAVRGTALHGPRQRPRHQRRPGVRLHRQHVVARDSRDAGGHHRRRRRLRDLRVTLAWGLDSAAAEPGLRCLRCTRRPSAGDLHVVHDLDQPTPRRVEDLQVVQELATPLRLMHEPGA